MVSTLNPAKPAVLSRVCLTVDALVILICLVLGVRTGEYAYFVAASGLAVLAPLWFLHPVTLTTPMSDLVGQRSPHARVPVALTVLGAALLLISLGMALANLLGGSNV